MIKPQAFPLAAFVYLLLTISSCSLFAQSKPPAKPQPAAPVKQELKFRLLKDSTFERWNITGAQELYGNATMDASGVIYALITETDGSHHVGRLSGNQWESVDSAIHEPVKKLLNDGNGVVYAETGKQLYRLDHQQWIKVFDTTINGFGPWPALDGALYREIPIHNATYDWIASEIVKYVDGRNVPIGIDGQPFKVGRETKYYIDRRGNVYTVLEHHENKYYNPPKKDVVISMLNGKTNPIIGQLPYPITHSGFDADNNWYVSGYDGKNDKTAYFKKWDGKEWTDIPMPAGIRTDNTFSVANFFFDARGNLYLVGKGLDHNDKLNAWKDGKWKEVCSGYSDPPYTFIVVDEFMVSENNVYGIRYRYNSTEKKDYIEAYKRTGVWKVNTMEVASIPYNFNLDSADIFIGYKNFFRQYLFRENGKYGIQDSKGHVVAEAVFDKISCRKTPAHVLAVQGEESVSPFSAYSYELISGKDTIYANIGSFPPDPGTLNGLKRTVSSVCRHCNGTGKVSDRKEQVQVRGDWVGERSTTGTKITYDNVWDAANRGYVTVKTTTTTTNTSGGYYKPGSYKTVLIPGGVCNYCNGKASVWNFELYEFDREKGVYVKTWR